MIFLRRNVSRKIVEFFSFFLRVICEKLKTKRRRNLASFSRDETPRFLCVDSKAPNSNDIASQVFPLGFSAFNSLRLFPPTMIRLANLDYLASTYGG